MTLQQLLHKARGNYELTIFWGDRRPCEDEEIPDVDPDMGEHVDFRNYVNEWDAIKNCRVEDFTLTTNRNYNGPAIYVSID